MTRTAKNLILAAASAFALTAFAARADPLYPTAVRLARFGGAHRLHAEWRALADARQDFYASWGGDPRAQARFESWYSRSASFLRNREWQLERRRRWELERRREQWER